ncbi:MAG: tRNA lysidine(34) synthetase TilS [Patescibacteria group bacterium]
MKVLIAVSGGVDSVALLDLLAKKKLGGFLGKNLPPIELVGVAHFNHRIHRDAAAHQKFVRDLAAKYRLPFFTKRATTKLKSEAEARDARYKFLKAVARKTRADTIALAHHADDQVETVLLNVIRGSGLLGLSGMAESRDGLWRPLLAIAKKRLFEHCKKNRLKFVYDPTNDDANYSRNFVRLKIIGEMERLNPKVREAFLRLAQHAREGAELAELLAREFLIRCATAKSIPLNEFNALPPAVAKAVIRQIYCLAVGNLQKIEALHVSEILELAKNPAGNKTKKFGELTFRTGKSGDKRVLAWK